MCNPAKVGSTSEILGSEIGGTHCQTEIKSRFFPDFSLRESVPDSRLRSALALHLVVEYWGVNLLIAYWGSGYQIEILNIIFIRVPSQRRSS